MEERLQLLIQERDLLSIKLSELNYLIKGYEDTLKAQKEEAENVQPAEEEASE